MKKTLLTGCVLAVLALSGCATSAYDRPYGYNSQYDYGYHPEASQHTHYGAVVGVRYVQDDGVAGAVAGAVIGGLIGTQIGGGDGRTAATVGGAIAGGVIGRNVDRRNSSYNQAIDVRLDGGEVVTIVQKGGDEFRAGQRVRIMGTGSNARVVLY